MDILIQNAISELIRPILSALGISVEIDFQKEGDQYRISVSNSKGGGLKFSPEVLKSIQHLIRVAVHRKFPEDKTHFFIDIDGYKSKRERLIKNSVPQLAQEKVLSEGKTVILIGLSGYERMIVHQLLADIKGLITNSVGERNSRKLLIIPTSETGSGSMDDGFVWNINEHQES